jgi:hypothetical protein
VSLACKLYADDNSAKIVSAYPTYGGFTNGWCGGNAEADGSAGSYIYGGSDPTGIQTGALWPYTKALGIYHCPADHRVATAAPIPQYNNKPILRSISMSSFMGGRSYGTAQDWVVWPPSSAVLGMDSQKPCYLKETEMKKPSDTWLVLDEDQGIKGVESINDAMFLVNVGSQAFPDFPSRAHGMAFGVNFNDGHAEIHKLLDAQSATWTATSPTAGPKDWGWLKDHTTFPK